MPRPRKCRRVCHFPDTLSFAPLEPADDRPVISFSLEEYETIRLIDREGFSQEQCSEQMQVARTTVTGIYDSARYKMAKMLVFGLGLTVSGGDVDVCGSAGTCCGKCGVGQCQCDNPSCTRKAAMG